jgi:RluA family pseudouridine synthase
MQSFCYSRQNRKETLIAFLVRRFPYQNEAAWRVCIADGEVKVNAARSDTDRLLCDRDIVSYERPKEKEPPIDDRYEILFQDRDIVVVAKNGNIPISESGKYHHNTLIQLLKDREGFAELYPVHRLDKETSGLVLIARTRSTATLLGAQFVRQIPEKTYHAILVGEFDTDRILVDEPIKRCSPAQSSIRIRQVVDPAGKPSKTLFFREQIASGLTLARIKTFSGRTHQIRCHAAHFGHPVLGDKLYGQSDAAFLAFLEDRMAPMFEPWGRFDRQLLHASVLSLPHPQTGEWMTWQSDYRPEFSAYERVKGLLV